jgi:hypothetical protein
MHGESKAKLKTIALPPTRSPALHLPTERTRFKEEIVVTPTNPVPLDVKMPILDKSSNLQ